ncbi:hypothetical protein TSTA_042080 [Talaromyces stipitatus ATCC 10500]|uniref:Uncharacterized protein n=1 Tax=Talaromyces stipitatus (strain ATCC 10500 / CBS 375.48 / QM 6759 / NRRL 1006) TaxID=441959 RepID=B8MJR6_TALSN|nr:uncharacterized protein TSTA_042080 [Talaromyces stipitatus ATCC 10500]EED14733.1 hypothetical protein TSTA_042080 [Talaromyces stipitatus ATCC 10500]
MQITLVSDQIESEIRAKFAELEDQKSDPRSPEESVTGDIGNSTIALRHVRRYIEFVEKDITPTWKHAAGTTQCKVRFLDLGIFFQPGELIYVPSLSEWPPDQVWLGQPEYPTTSGDFARLAAIAFQGTTFATYDTPPKLDGQGTSDLVLSHRLRRYSSPAFGGFKNITLQEQGEWFQTITSTERHLYYDGWAFAHEPRESIQPAEQTNSEYVDSQAMVDFVEGHKSNNNFAKSSDLRLRNWKTEWRETTDPMHIYY